MESLKAELAGSIPRGLPAVIPRHRRDAYDTFGLGRRATR
jgi:hypothetical protein